MKWRQSGPCAVVSEDGRYTLNRSPQEGWPGLVTYMLCCDGKIIGIEPNLPPDDEDAKRAARLRLLALCKP